MNILYLSEDYHYSKVHHELVSRLSNIKNVNVTICSTLRDSGKNKRISENYTNINYEVFSKEISRNIEWRYKFDFVFKIKTKCNFILDNIAIESYDMIHAATLFSEGYAAYKLYKRYNIPYVVAVRGSDINFYLKYMPHLWRIGIKILSHAKHIIFITPIIKNKLLQFPILSNSVKSYISSNGIVIPNGIDDYWLTHTRIKRKIKSASNILYIGIFDNNKNVLKLMEAIISLHSVNPSLKLTLIGGSGNKHNDVIKLANAYPEVFSYLGKIYNKDHLLEVMRNNDIFAMPSHSETFGLVYLEALSQGLPILYSKGQGIDGIFKEKIGESVDSHSVESIKLGLSSIVTEYNSYSDISKHIHEYSWDSVTKKHFSIYNQ